MAKKAPDMTGTRFGMLRVVKQAPKLAGGRVRWICRCDCGRDVDWSAGAIQLQMRKGINSSCGCNRGKALRTHGMCQTPEYTAWAGLIQRCTNPNSTYYANYGGRGITVSEEWREFTVFYRDMGPRPPGTSIERVRNNEGYHAGNCVWATRKEQARNQRSNRMLTAGGVTQTLAAWAEKLGVGESVIRRRLYRGWPEDAACTYPKAKHWSRQPGTYAAAGFPVSTLDTDCPMPMHSTSPLPQLEIF